MIITRYWLSLLASCVLLMQGTVIAQGVVLSAGGPVHRGMGGASTAAPTSAIGALYWNPATISGLASTETEFGLDILSIDHQVSSSIGGLSGTTDANAGTFPLPNVGWVYRTNNAALTVGVGVNSVAGFKTSLAVDPSNPVLAPASAGGLGPVSSEASFVQIAPVVSFAFSDRLSVAVGPTITSGQIGIEPFIFDSANTDGTYPSGRSTQYQWGGGVQAGIYYLSGCWHYGASLKSTTWMNDFESYGVDQNGLPRKLRAKVDLPMIVSLGTAYTGLEDWTFALDGRFFDYENTDGFGDPATFDATGALQGLDYSSIFALAFGAQKRCGDHVYLRGGYTYNQNPVSNSEAFFNIASPLIYEHMLSGGASYLLNENLAINVAYSHIFENTREGPIVLPGTGAVPGSSFLNKLAADVFSFGIVMRH